MVVVSVSRFPGIVSLGHDGRGFAEGALQEVAVAGVADASRRGGREEPASLLRQSSRFHQRRGLWKPREMNLERDALPSKTKLFCIHIVMLYLDIFVFVKNYAFSIEKKRVVS